MRKSTNFDFYKPNTTCPLAVGQKVLCTWNGPRVCQVEQVRECRNSCDGNWMIKVVEFDFEMSVCYFYPMTPEIEVELRQEADEAFTSTCVRYGKALVAKDVAFRKADEARLAAEATLDEFYEAKAALFAQAEGA